MMITGINLLQSILKLVCDEPRFILMWESTLSPYETKKIYNFKFWELEGIPLRHVQFYHFIIH